MATWRDYLEYAASGEHTVTGTVKVLPDLWSPQLYNQRDILVYLPPTYDRDPTRCYPVLYMHDGQNLFDHATSFAGEWQVDESMEALSEEDLGAIVVAIPNMQQLRMVEYTPFRDESAGGGLGESYLAFIIETIKPLIDADFRTLPACRHTGLVGSSLGGLISLYGLFRHPQVFGLVGALSPSVAFRSRAMFDFAVQAPTPGGRIYMDVGTREAGHVAHGEEADDWSLAYLQNVRDMYELLLTKGYQPGNDLLYVEEAGAIHQESAWACRLPGALRFLLQE